MLRLKMSLIAGLIIFLSGCVSSQPRPSFTIREERCVVSVEFDKCRCHEYLITEKFSGRVSESVDRDLAYCDRFVGFSAESWVRMLNVIQGIGQKYGPKTLKMENGYDLQLLLMELEQ